MMPCLEMATHAYGCLTEAVTLKKCTIGELKAAITGKIRQIPKEECVRVIDNFARRVVPVCLQRRGQHFILYFEKSIKTMQTDSGG